jgi:hypothetical protein
MNAPEVFSRYTFSNTGRGLCYLATTDYCANIIKVHVPCQVSEEWGNLHSPQRHVRIDWAGHPAQLNMLSVICSNGGHDGHVAACYSLCPGEGASAIGWLYSVAQGGEQSEL